MKYEYRTVAFKTQLTRKDTANAISRQIEEIIDEHARNGWEFDCIDDVGVSINPGCIASRTTESILF